MSKISLDVADVVTEKYLEDDNGQVQVQQSDGISGVPYDNLPIFGPLGVTSRPADPSDDMTAQSLIINDGQAIVIGYRDNRIKIKADEGELVLHDLSPVPLSKIRLKPDGTIEIEAGTINISGDVNLNGNSDTVVMAKKWISIYNQLVSVLSNHVHMDNTGSLTSIPGGSTVPGQPTTFILPPITADDIGSERTKIGE